MPRRSLSRHQILDLLAEARARTFLLVAPLSEQDLQRQHSALMSPIIWDLGHIGHFEEVWLVEKLIGSDVEGEGLRGIYNPFENPRASRAELELPGRTELMLYLRRVRERVMDQLDRTLLSGSGPLDEDLIQDGFVYRMVLQHEYQHNETILQTLQLKQGSPYIAPRARFFTDGRSISADTMCRFPGGDVYVGTNDRSAAYDNERPEHRVTLPAFEIDRTPVTCGMYLDFIEDGGYRNRTHWSAPGWAWKEDARAVAPLYWFHEEAEWRVRLFDRTAPPDPERPVQHVCWYEAEAFANWAGKRLPTEFEWEAAAVWDPGRMEKGPYPWGSDLPDGSRANLDALAFEPAPVGSFPEGVSPIGCEQMIGDVWEWTSSWFKGYPGYRTFPYKEYSEVFFGDEYRVLRGGSWATRPGAIRTTFRNWDYPIRRQIFSGFRCARDV